MPQDDSFIDFELKHLTQTYKPTRALDLGAGQLRQSIEMANEGIKVDAVEPKPPESIQLPANLNLHITTVEDFEYGNNLYDLVLLRMVAQRLSPQTIINLFESILPQTLTAKGLVYLVVPAKYALPANLEHNFIIRGSHEFDVQTSDFKVIRSLVLEKKN